MLVCFVALRPKSTAMVMAGQSVHTDFIMGANTRSLESSPILVHIVCNIGYQSFKCRLLITIRADNNGCEKQEVITQDSNGSDQQNST